MGLRRHREFPVWASGVSVVIVVMTVAFMATACGGEQSPTAQAPVTASSAAPAETAASGTAAASTTTAAPPETAAPTTTAAPPTTAIVTTTTTVPTTTTTPVTTAPPAAVELPDWITTDEQVAVWNILAASDQIPKSYEVVGVEVSGDWAGAFVADGDLQIFPVLLKRAAPDGWTILDVGKMRTAKQLQDKGVPEDLAGYLDCYT